MGSSHKKADAIRRFVATNFSGVGRFQSKDVLNHGDADQIEWTTSHIGAALQTWANNGNIFEGHRLRKHGEGRATAYELVPVSAEGVGDQFTAEILESREDGSMLVKTPDGKYLKVSPLKW